MFKNATLPNNNLGTTTPRFNQPLANHPTNSDNADVVAGPSNAVAQGPLNSKAGDEIA
jgi:hypothetical protein